MIGNLDGKVVIVTGAGRGIGASLAKVFARAGAKVMLATRTAKYGEATLDEITQAGGVAALCSVDIGTLKGVEETVSETVNAWGGVDIMIHNAASFQGNRVERYTEENLESVLALNLKACWRLSAACIPHLRRRGGGRLLFTSSVTGPRVVQPGNSYYAASKGGVNAFIKTAAIEFARENITVNGVEPGWIRTPTIEGGLSEEQIAEVSKYIPMGHMGDPDDIAYTMLFLASDEARYITGQTIIVDGGSTLPETPAFMK